MGDCAGGGVPYSCSHLNLGAFLDHAPAAHTPQPVHTPRPTGQQPISSQNHLPGYRAASTRGALPSRLSRRSRMWHQNVITAAAAAGAQVETADVHRRCRRRLSLAPPHSHVDAADFWGAKKQVKCVENKTWHEGQDFRHLQSGVGRCGWVGAWGGGGSGGRGGGRRHTS